MSQTNNFIVIEYVTAAGRMAFLMEWRAAVEARS